MGVIMNTNTKNAQIKSLLVGEWLNEMPFTSTHWRICSILFIAFVIESWEMMILIFSSTSIGEDFGLGTGQIGSLIGALFLGMIPGALIWGKLISSIGRKKCLMMSVGLYGIFPIASALAPSYEFLWAARFLCGVVLAGCLVVTFPYFEELVPVKTRGKATVYLSSGWPLGILIAIGITTLFSDMGWRVVLGVGSIASLWALVVWKWVPESPYWLAEQGRKEEANQSLMILSEAKLGKISVKTDKTKNVQASTFLDLFKQPYLKTTLLQTIINFCFSWGYWAMASWMPLLLAKRGLSAPEGLGFIAISTLFMFPGYITASYVTGKFGRKIAMVSFVFIAAVAGFGFAYSQTMNQMYFWNFALSFFSLGAWGVWNTWLAEIYDTKTRGHGTALGITSQRVANSIAPIAIGAMLGSGSFLQTVVFISCFLAITFITALFLPETEGEMLH